MVSAFEWSKTLIDAASFPALKIVRPYLINIQLFREGIFVAVFKIIMFSTSTSNIHKNVVNPFECLKLVYKVIHCR